MRPSGSCLRSLPINKSYALCIAIVDEQQYSDTPWQTEGSEAQALNERSQRQF
jgi:hypothetical protein